MNNILLEIIIIIFLICLLILIILQIRKTYNINKVLIDTTNIIENFESTDKNDYSCKGVYDILKNIKDFNIEHIKENTKFRNEILQHLKTAPSDSTDS